MRVLVLGASGMLGNAMVRVLGECEDLELVGTSRCDDIQQFFSMQDSSRLLTGVDVNNNDTLVNLFSQVRPDTVVNCIGLIKRLPGADDPLVAIPVNSLLPHRLARLSEVAGARLVHVSTDCVFSGARGAYTETDTADAVDLYGMSKYLGEVHYTHSITLRTSVIGHELRSSHGLIGWFLDQKESCQGFTRAIFSGLPAVVLAQIVRDVVIPRPNLSGLYHVASDPISKYDLLKLVAEVYGKSIRVIPDDSVVIDHSLNAQRFQAATGYITPEWPRLIDVMYSYFQ